MSEIAGMCARCGDHPPRSPNEPFCPICVISLKVEVARGISQLDQYLRRHAEFNLWLAEHART